jgi:hypothetical protein
VEWNLHKMCFCVPLTSLIKDFTKQLWSLLKLLKQFSLLMILKTDPKSKSAMVKEVQGLLDCYLMLIFRKIVHHLFQNDFGKGQHLSN